MPTRILTVGKVVAVNIVHLPLQGKVTFVDIADDDNTELLYRYCFKSSNFRKFAEQLIAETVVVAEGEITHHGIMQPQQSARMTLLVAGKVLRILHSAQESNGQKTTEE